TPNQQCGSFRFEQGNDVAFQIASGDRVISLQRVEPSEVFEFRDAERLRDLPGVPVRTTDVTNLALAHENVERVQRLLDGRDRIVGVNLVEIDVVRLQAAQTSLHRVENMSARCAYRIASWSNTAGDLRGDHHVRTL